MPFKETKKIGGWIDIKRNLDMLNERLWIVIL